MSARHKDAPHCSTAGSENDCQSGIELLVVMPLFGLTCFGIKMRVLLLLTLRSLTLYIYGAPILDVSRSHTTTQHSR